MVGHPAEGSHQHLILLAPSPGLAASRPVRNKRQLAKPPAPPAVVFCYSSWSQQGMLVASGLRESPTEATCSEVFQENCEHCYWACLGEVFTTLEWKRNILLFPHQAEGWGPKDKRLPRVLHNCSFSGVSPPPGELLLPLPEYPNLCPEALQGFCHSEVRVAQQLRH